MAKYLSDLKVGDVATITKLDSDNNMRRRIRDIGMIEGTSVECVSISPLGDPIAFEICGAVIAFRREDIKGIQVI